MLGTRAMGGLSRGDPVRLIEPAPPQRYAVQLHETTNAAAEVRAALAAVGESEAMCADRSKVECAHQEFDGMGKFFGEAGASIASGRRGRGQRVACCAHTEVNSFLPGRRRSSGHCGRLPPPRAGDGGSAAHGHGQV